MLFSNFRLELIAHTVEYLYRKLQGPRCFITLERESLLQIMASKISTAGCVYGLVYCQINDKAVFKNVIPFLRIKNCIMQPSVSFRRDILFLFRCHPLRYAGILCYVKQIEIKIS